MTTNRANIPSTAFDNLFAADPTGAALFESWIGPARFAAVRGHFVAMGQAGALATPLSARADRQAPVLLTHDATGERVDRVVQHPDYHELERLSYGRGIVGVKYRPGFLGADRDIRHLVGFGAGYYFAQTEMGLYCPICMTDGVGRVLERFAPGDPLARETLAHLAATDMAELWQGAMFLTERQGGSDVGANTVTARQEGGRWLLEGDKWFCSNVAADAILALARMPGGPEGTRGLGMFLVLRRRPPANGATIRVHRLKDKLGVRSMPTGEVTFERTEAHLIGGIGHGFKQMTEMLNLSRLYNAVASVAAARRAVLEAHAYGSERRAFGSRLVELPLWRAAMADLVAEQLGAFLLAFEAVRALDRADCGDEASRRLARLAVPVAKALTGKLAIFAVSEAMEAIGGNAYVEESILPRLLRDCQVLPIWEGTTHVLTLDAMRAVRKEAAHEALAARIRGAFEHAAGGSARLDLAAARSKEAAELLAAASRLESELQARAARGWLERAGRALELALLLENACHEPLREVCLAAFDRLAAREFGVMPVGVGDPTRLRPSEAALLDSVRPA